MRPHNIVGAGKASQQRQAPRKSETARMGLQAAGTRFPHPLLCWGPPRLPAAGLASLAALLWGAARPTADAQGCIALKRALDKVPATTGIAQAWLRWRPPAPAAALAPPAVVAGPACACKGGRGGAGAGGRSRLAYCPTLLGDCCGSPTATSRRNSLPRKSGDEFAFGAPTPTAPSTSHLSAFPSRWKGAPGR